MYFIDLSLRNLEQGYVDSIALIADVIGANELTDLLAAVDSADSMEALDDIIAKAEDIAADYGFHASPYEGRYYVMTHGEFDIWWAPQEV